jgi:hypothetical protein
MAVPAGAAPSTGVTYAIVDAVATPTCSSSEPCVVDSYDYAGDGAGSSCQPVDPCRGTFLLRLIRQKAQPVDPCRMKTGTGTLGVVWSDASTTSGTFSFKARDSKTFSLTGQITGGNPRFAVGAKLSGLVAQPVDPCQGGLVAASITLG